MSKASSEEKAQRARIKQLMAEFLTHANACEKHCSQAYDVVPAWRHVNAWPLWHDGYGREELLLTAKGKLYIQRTAGRTPSSHHMIGRLPEFYLNMAESGLRRLLQDIPDCYA